VKKKVKTVKKSKNIIQLVEELKAPKVLSSIDLKDLYYRDKFKN